MSTDDLLLTRIFWLLSEPSQEVTNEEMQEAYGEFVEQIRTVSNGNTSMSQCLVNRFYRIPPSIFSFEPNCAMVLLMMLPTNGIFSFRDLVSNATQTPTACPFPP